MSFSCRREDVTVPDGDVKIHKVAVVVPAGIRENCERTVKWALENIHRAQAGLDSRIYVEVEWHDEDASDIAEYLNIVATDDSYSALIGPMSSSKAREAAAIMALTGKTVILPIATSTEFQRIFAGKDYVWNLAESDITQSEILLTQAKASGYTSVALLTSSDDYGRSFSDWFAYQATEIGIDVRDVFIYSSDSELETAVQTMSEYRNPSATMLLFAPSKAADAVVFDRKFGRLKGDRSFLPFPDVMCADVVNSSEIAARLENREYEGVSPCADPTSGFMDAYKLKFGVEPVDGEAHLFDAVSLLAYAFAAESDGESLSQTIKRIVDGKDKESHGWLPEDMRETFSFLYNGVLPDLKGVTGDWSFDSRNHASVLNTTYSHWILRNGKFTTVEYLSVDGGHRTTSTLQVWDEEATRLQRFDRNQAEITYGDLNDNYAIVIGASDTWNNYRHQADALAMYQLLKRHGYDDDHIILIIEDNLAYHPLNPSKGTVRVRPDGENLYVNVKVDYKLSSISFSDLKEIVSGCVSDRLPVVLDSSCRDNVMIFWCGHGDRDRLAWGSDRMVRGEDMRDMIAEMVGRHGFRKLLMVMDACYSGTIGEACVGLPGVLVFTAANSMEPSKADMRDPQSGIWLSNGFTRIFMETVDADASISLRDLYYTVARHTTGSHATIYNIENYGNAFTSDMSEFLK